MEKYIYGKFPYKPLRTRINKKIINLTNKSIFTGSGTATTNNKGEFYFITLSTDKNTKVAGMVNIRVEHRELGVLQRLILNKNVMNRESCGEINPMLYQN